MFKNNLIGNTDVTFTQAANNVSISDFQLIRVEFGDIDNNGDLLLSEHAMGIPIINNNEL